MCGIDLVVGLCGDFVEWRMHDCAAKQRWMRDRPGDELKDSA